MSREIAAKVQKPHDYRLDFIRCFAMWQIITYHFCVAMGMNASFFCGYKNGGWGSVGTAQFFILSGYCLLFGHKRLEAKGGVREFYKKRFLSIFPLLWLTFAAGYLIQSLWLYNFLYGGSPWKIILSVLGVDGYATFFGVQDYFVIGEWFTAIILLVYLIYPLLNWLFFHHRWSTTGVLFCCYILNAVFSKQIPPDAGLLTGVFMFWVGMLIHQYQEFIWRSRRMLIPAAAALIALVMYVPLPYVNSPLPWKNLLALCIFILLYLILSYIHISSAALKMLCEYEGRLCFAVYLCHHQIIYLLPLFLARLGYTVSSVLLLYILNLIAIEIASIVLYQLCQLLMKGFQQLSLKRKEVKKCTRHC